MDKHKQFDADRNGGPSETPYVPSLPWLRDYNRDRRDDIAAAIERAQNLPDQSHLDQWDSGDVEPPEKSPLHGPWVILPALVAVAILAGFVLLVWGAL